MRYRLLKTTEYEEWLNEETIKSKVQIAERLEKIESEGYFGLHKDLGDSLFELKWGNGRRVYYSVIPPDNVILLLRGNKNGQSKDIKKAKNILGYYLEE